MITIQRKMTDNEKEAAAEQWWNDKEPKFSDLIGKEIDHIKGMENGSEEVQFFMSDGTKYVLHHRQDCCESVELNDVIGSPEDLIKRPLTMAELVTSEDDPEGFTPEDAEWRESFTWSFYKLATVRGYVTLRWLGESNGYYSETVDFARFETW